MSSDIYINLDGVNSSNSGVLADAKIVFSSSTPLLQNPSEYKGTVVRLTLPIQEIPIFLFDGNEVTSNYIVTCSFGGLEVSVPLLFTTEWVNSSPATNQFYYGIYFIEHMIDMLNFAIRSAWTAVGSPYASPPWFGFNPTTEIFTLYYPQAYIGGGFRMWFNNRLRILFSGFYCLFSSYSAAKGTEFLFFRQYSNGSANNIPIGLIYPDGSASATLTWYQNADYSTLPSWYQFDKVIMTCNNIPAEAEFTNPVNLNQTSSSSDATLPILTDFVINLNDTNKDLRGILEYAPTAEFRWFDMNGNAPMTSVTVDFYAVPKTSLSGTTQLYKIPITPGETIHTKLLFRKKTEFCNCNNS